MQLGRTTIQGKEVGPAQFMHSTLRRGRTKTKEVPDLGNRKHVLGPSPKGGKDWLVLQKKTTITRAPRVRGGYSQDAKKWGGWGDIQFP